MRRGITSIIGAALLAVTLSACDWGEGCGGSPTAPAPTIPTCEIVHLSWTGLAGTSNAVTIRLRHPDGSEVVGTFNFTIITTSGEIVAGALSSGNTIVIPLAIPPGGGPPAPTLVTLRAERGGCTSYASLTVPL